MPLNYIYPPVANVVVPVCAEKYERWLAVDKAIAIISMLTFLPTLYTLMPIHSGETAFFAQTS